MKKKGWTKPQSASYANREKKYIPQYFGHDRARNVLVGIGLTPEDTTLYRIFLYDRGTIDRPYDGSKEEVQAYLKRDTVFTNYKELIDEARKRGEQCNEVMVRFRLPVEDKWPCKRIPHIIIFTDNLESRLLAQVRALDLERAIKDTYKKEIKLPISFYDSGKIYSKDEQLNDRNSVPTFSLLDAHRLFCEHHASHFTQLVKEEWKTLIPLILNLSAITLAIAMSKDKVFFVNTACCYLGGLVQLFNKLKFSNEQRIVFCKTFENQLTDIIKTTQDFRLIMEVLIDRNERALFFESVKIQLPQIIKTSWDYRYLYFAGILSDVQRTVVFEACKNTFPEIIEDAIDFRDIMECLTDEQRAMVFDVLKDRLSAIINNGYDFRIIMEFLTDKQCEVILNTYKIQLPEIINNGYDFRIIMKILIPTLRTMVFKACQIKLIKIIKNVRDFRVIMEILTDEQRTVILDAYKAQLPGIITDIIDFYGVMDILTPTQRAVAFEACQVRLPQIIKTVQEFSGIMEFLTNQEKFALQHAMKLSHELSPSPTFFSVKDTERKHPLPDSPTRLNR